MWQLINAGKEKSEELWRIAKLHSDCSTNFSCPTPQSGFPFERTKTNLLIFSAPIIKIQPFAYKGITHIMWVKIIGRYISKFYFCNPNFKKAGQKCTVFGT